MASFPVTTYGDWAVTKTLKEGEVVLGDGEKPRDGKLWVTVTKKDSSSTAGMAATGGYSTWPVMGTAEDPTAASAAANREKQAGEEEQGSDEAYVFDASLIHGWPFSPWLGADRWAKLASGVHLRSSDVVVATYPKSGTTLAEQAILLFLARGDASLLMPGDKNAIGHRRGPDAARFAKVRSLRCASNTQRINYLL